MTTAARRGYPTSTVVGAVLATLFFPLISLIAALLLQGREQDPEKRADLRRWAWLSAGWITLQVVVFALVVAIVFSSGSTSIER